MHNQSDESLSAGREAAWQRRRLLICVCLRRQIRSGESSSYGKFQGMILSMSKLLALTKQREIRQALRYALSDDADGLVTLEGHLRLVYLDHFPVVLVGPASVVAEATGGFHDVEALGDVKGLAIVLRKLGRSSQQAVLYAGITPALEG